jgi:predicted dehydrogenase
MAKLRLALLGTGGMAGVHAGRFRRHPDVEIVALCDVSEKVIAAFIARANLGDYQPRPQRFTDAATLFREAKLDAVAIATPHTLHFEHAMLAADAGVHVFLEKPMVTSAEQAHALAAKFTATGKILTIGYNTPCTPVFDWLRTAIRLETLGKLELVSGYLSQDWLNITKGSWRQNPKLSGGGQAYDSGAHLLNSLCWSVESDVGEVFAFVDHHGTAVDINSSINVRFTNGVMASIVISGNCPANGSSMHFIFERGRVDIDGWSGEWIKVWDGASELKDLVLPGKKQTPDDNFVDAALGRAEPRTTVQNGIVHSELMDAIYESARTGLVARPKPGS